MSIGLWTIALAFAPATVSLDSREDEWPDVALDDVMPTGARPSLTYRLR